MKTPWLSVVALCAAGVALAAEKPVEPPSPWRQEANFPVVDLSGETARQVVIAAGTPNVYQGHPTTLLHARRQDHVCRLVHQPRRQGGADGTQRRRRQHLDAAGRPVAARVHASTRTARASTAWSIRQGKERLWVFSAWIGRFGNPCRAS